MNRRPVRSTNIASMGFEEEGEEEYQTRGTLEVEFRSGHIYRYEGVPKVMFEAALGASSVGKFLAENVYQRFDGTRVK